MFISTKTKMNDALLSCRIISLQESSASCIFVLVPTRPLFRPYTIDVYIVVFWCLKILNSDLLSSSGEAFEVLI
jgi:hypothetical protein